MTLSSTSVSPAISGTRKAAMFLMGLGNELGADLLRRLDADEIRAITTEISAMRSVAPEHMLFVFREFESLTRTGQFFAKGGAEFARRLTEQALGPESAKNLLNRPASAPSKSQMELLEGTRPHQLAQLLLAENPQTIALVLSNLSLAQAGALMAVLPEELLPQVALRMASLDHISPEIFQRFMDVVGSKLKAVKRLSRSDGIRLLAGLLNRLEPARAEAILNRLEAENQPIAAVVRDLIFVFEDIVNVDAEGMKALVSKLDRKILITALKGTTPEIRAHFTRCMSERAAEMMSEGMEALGAVRIRDVQAAQQQVAALVRQLQQSGAISASAGNDQYVV